jgi:transcription elongation GreA/GreB family factor
MSSIHPDVAKVVASGKLPAAHAQKISDLALGVFVVHKSWGVGRIAAWELFDEKIVIDFEEQAGRGLKLEFAAKTLDVIPDTHILARRHADVETLKTLAQKDATTLTREILQSFGGSMSLDAYEAVVKPRIVPEAKFKTWWDNTKKVLKANTAFIVPSKRNIPLELRAGDLSALDALTGDFRRARGVKEKAKALDAIARDSAQFTNPDDLAAILKEADEVASQNLRLKTVDALDLMLSRDELRDKVPALHGMTSPTLATAMKEDGLRLAENVGSLAVAKQRRVFDALVDATGATGVAALLPLLNRLSTRSIHELCSVLREKNATTALNAFLKQGIVHRTLSSEVLVWISRERGGMSADVFGPEMSGALLSAMERDHFDDENRKANRVNDALLSDRELISDLITGVELPQVRIFARQFMQSASIDEMGKRSILARFIRVYPEIEELIHESQNEKEEVPLLVSWKSLTEKKAAYDHLVNVELPKNREDISIARSYGDLRENFEYKSAKEYARVLARRKFEMERDLQRAQGTNFEDATTDKVTMGCKVDIADVATEAKETFIILGAWDTNIAEGIISYLSVTGAALLGKAIGETIDLPTEESNVVRKVKVVGITKHPMAPSA